jgi:HAD superfamily hydrolase (TIGR01509 family)
VSGGPAGRVARAWPAVEAVVFDMDGLMFDSERVAREAWRAALLARGYVLTDEVYLRAVGRTAAEALHVFTAAFGDGLPAEAVEQDKAARLLELLGEAPPLKPGLAQVLDEADRLGLPAAVASATASPEVRRRLAAAGLERRFAVVVGGDEVRAGKPAPDLFLRAAELLDAPPAACLVLEDAEAGIRAAAAAGMPAVMVPDLVRPSSACRALCAAVVTSLADVVPLLRGLAAGEPATAGDGA